MTKPIIISPSILSADFSRLGEQVSLVERAGADWIHIDVMDGHFVPNITMGPVIVKHVRTITNLPLDVHLMIDHPELFVSDFAEAGADHLIIHVESTPHIHRVIQRIHQLGLKAGAALNPGTPPETLTEILSMLDLVLVMSVNPGYAGQKFIRSTPNKIQRIRNLISNLDKKPIIEVDGGISAATLPAAYHAGADAFVAASAIYNHPDGPEEGVLALMRSIPGEG